MNKVEFQTARGVLRLAGVGLMPHADVTNRALNSLQSLRSHPAAQDVGKVLDSIAKGILPHQRACLEAAQSLERPPSGINLTLQTIA